MTSLPRPLKFLRPAYSSLKENFEKVTDIENRVQFFFNFFCAFCKLAVLQKVLADILSVLAMTYARTERATRDSLNFKLKGNTLELEAWGHEYVRFAALAPVFVSSAAAFELQHHPLRLTVL
jgi:26S proteasome regulatory subunit N1